MQLRDLLARDRLPDLNVTGLTSDSRKVVKGDLFIAYKGSRFDGNRFALEAIANGAVAVLAESAPPHEVAVPWVVEPAAARLRSAIAARFYDHPSLALDCIGITGTNGKTSIAYGIAGALESTAFAGSLGWGVLPTLCETGLTTIDPIGVQGSLAHLQKRGIARVAMEVSSHALAQGRVAAVKFDVGIFSNLTRDHLDYHGSMARYGDAKAELFRKKDLQLAIINIDDPFSACLADILQANDVPILKYGVGKTADLSWHDLNFSSSGVQGTWKTPWGYQFFDLPVYSEHYVANCSAILATLCHYDLCLTEAVERLHRLRLPPGRMEYLARDDAPNFVIDYAHTPDALATVLDSMRSVTKGQLWCVFGCGGDRDSGKRGMMAEVAETMADRVIVTSDNPRSEAPQKIADEVCAGFTDSANVIVELDRKAAIRRANSEAAPSDTIVVAGKGDERTQEINGQHIPYNDRDAVAQVLRGSR